MLYLHSGQQGVANRTDAGSSRRARLIVEINNHIVPTAKRTTGESCTNDRAPSPFRRIERFRHMQENRLFTVTEGAVLPDVRCRESSYGLISETEWRGVFGFAENACDWCVVEIDQACRIGSRLQVSAIGGESSTLWLVVRPTTGRSS